MAIRKNKKRIDPRYFLHETTYRDLDEQPKPVSEGVAGGIDEFAKEYGVAPLSHRFNDQELVDFTYRLLEATSAEVPTVEPFAGPRHVKPRPHGQTIKQGGTTLQRWEKTGDLGGRQSGDHPLTTSGAGFALEKLIQERFRKSQDPEMRQQLQDARMALLNAVSPTGRAAGFAARAKQRSDIRKGDTPPVQLPYGGQRPAKWSDVS